MLMYSNNYTDNLERIEENMGELQKRILLGCIADDFTGASDAASFLQKAGMHPVLVNEVPESIEIPHNADAVVVALKSRTAPKEEAVDETIKAVQWLDGMGVEKFYFKYCSTFDSTKEGNIGPVSDAVMEYFHQPYTILCPALPVNGRTVQGGYLYVCGVPLSESPMKDHPLTPMRDSRIKNLIEAQSKYQAVELPGDIVNEEELKGFLEEKEKKAEHFYVIPDYMDDKDGKKIVELFGHMKFLTGGSGILEFLGTYLSDQEGQLTIVDKNNSQGVVFAGSCSVATLEQIRDYQSRGHVSLKIDPLSLLKGEQTMEGIVDFVQAHPDDEVLVYSSDTADQIKEIQKMGREKIAELIEKTLSGAAAVLAEKGYRRIVVAGGETSGAVTKALGYDAFEIGPSVAPGVPVMTPLKNRNMKLVLKSGNFGQKDFFARALAITKGEEHYE